MTKTEIERNLEAIQAEINKQVSSEDIQGVEGNLLALQSLSGLASEVAKAAEEDFLKKQGLIAEADASKYPAPTLEKIIKGKLAEELSLYNHTIRMCRNINNKAESLRTTISLYKLEIEAQLKQSNTRKS